MEQMSPDQAKARFLDAINMEQNGDLSEAEAALRGLLEASPGNVRCLCLMGRVQRRMGQHSEASRYMTAAQAMAPEAPPVVYELAMLASDQEDLRGAAKHLRHLTELQPGAADTWYDLGLVYEKSGNLGLAIDAFRKAIQLGDTRTHETHTHLAAVLALDGQDDAARENYEKALEIDVGHAPALYGLGMVQTAFGDFERATKLFRRAIRHDPGLMPVYQQLAALRRFESTDDPDVVHLRQLIDSGELDERDQESLHYALGKMLADCEEYDTSFEHYARANELKCARVGRFDADEHDQYVDRIREIFDADFFAVNKQVGSSSNQPLFIVGMPRSGTSLVEQILASHPRVSGAGELPFIERASRQQISMYPDLMSSVDQGTLKKIAEDYLEQLQLREPNLRHITNKYPANFLHLGLIRMLFPNARIVHCRRDPLDTCLSMYFQDFAAGNLYANNFNDLARYYQSYQRLMNHWEHLFGDAICTVDYEKLTADVEAEVRALLEWLGLEWDPACLEYSNTLRAVSTMSGWQVRQPIYRSSVERWRRYEKHLDALKEALAAGSQE